MSSKSTAANIPVLALASILTISTLACGAGGPAGSDDSPAATGLRVTSPTESIPPLFDVDAQVAEWVDLWATYDLAGVDELFLAGPDTTYFSSEREGLIVGFDAIREHHAGFGFVEGGMQPEQELWVENVHATVFGTTALVNAVWFFGDRAAAATGGEVPQKGPMTAVFVLDGDIYRIAHMHFAAYTPEG